MLQRFNNNMAAYVKVWYDKGYHILVSWKYKA